jgi:hypothetical protein
LAEMFGVSANYVQQAGALVESQFSAPRPPSIGYAQLIAAAINRDAKC